MTSTTKDAFVMTLPDNKHNSKRSNKDRNGVTKRYEYRFYSYPQGLYAHFGWCSPWELWLVFSLGGKTITIPEQKCQISRFVYAEKEEKQSKSRCYFYTKYKISHVWLQNLLSSVKTWGAIRSTISKTHTYTPHTNTPVAPRRPPSVPCPKHQVRQRTRCTAQFSPPSRKVFAPARPRAPRTSPQSQIPSSNKTGGKRCIERAKT